MALSQHRVNQVWLGHGDASREIIGDVVYSWLDQQNGQMVVYSNQHLQACALCICHLRSRQHIIAIFSLCQLQILLYFAPQEQCKLAAGTELEF